MAPGAEALLTQNWPRRSQGRDTACASRFKKLALRTTIPA